MKKRMWKSIVCVLLAMLTLFVGCGTEPTAEEPLPSDDLQPLPPPVPVVVPLGERTEDGVVVTIHEGLLGNLSETLTEQQIADGFTAAARNEDGSVTYTIDATSYDAMVERYRADAYSAILYTVEDGSYYSLSAIDCAEDLSSITLHVQRAIYEDSMDALMIFGTGMIAITAQAYNVDAPGRCEITVVDEAGETISTTIYPDELVL